MNFIQINQFIDKSEEKRKQIDYFYSPYILPIKGKKKHRYIKDIAQDYADDAYHTEPPQQSPQEIPEIKSSKKHIQCRTPNIAARMVNERIDKINQSQSLSLIHI